MRAVPCCAGFMAPRSMLPQEPAKLGSRVVRVLPPCALLLRLTNELKCPHDASHTACVHRRHRGPALHPGREAACAASVMRHQVTSRAGTESSPLFGSLRARHTHHGPPQPWEREYSRLDACAHPLGTVDAPGSRAHQPRNSEPASFSKRCPQQRHGQRHARAGAHALRVRAAARVVWQRTQPVKRAWLDERQLGACQR